MKNQKLAKLIDEMKKISAQIGALRIARGMGKDVSMKEITAKEREFASLESKHKRLFFN